MSDRKLTVLMGVLTLLCGVALYRLFGSVAGGATIIALLSLVNTYRARQRARRRNVADVIAAFRAEAPEAREALLATVEDRALRACLTQALERDGSVEQEGDVERFPFPQSFRRWAKRRYWRNWSVGAMCLGIAALVPWMSGMWRLAWLAVGLGYVYALWRVSSVQRALDSII